MTPLIHKICLEFGEISTNHMQKKSKAKAIKTSIPFYKKSNNNLLNKIS
jgi:hypothetical protein